MFTDRHFLLVAVALLVTTGGLMGVLGQESAAVAANETTESAPTETADPVANDTTDPATNETPSAEQLLNESRTAMQNVDTLHTTMNASVTGQNVSMAFQSENVINRSAKRMRTNTTVEYNSSRFGGTMTMNSTEYVINDTRYSKFMGSWTAQPARTTVWNNTTTQTVNNAELQNQSTMSVVNTTTLDNESVYVIEIQPNESYLNDTGQRPATQMGSNATIENATVTQYTHYIQRMEIHMVMQTQSGPMTLNMTGENSDFGTNTTIELPDAAQNATALNASAS